MEHWRPKKMKFKRELLSLVRYRILISSARLLLLPRGKRAGLIFQAKYIFLPTPTLRNNVIELPFLMFCNPPDTHQTPKAEKLSKIPKINSPQVFCQQQSTYCKNWSLWVCVQAHSLVNIVALRHKLRMLLDILRFIGRRLILLLLSYFWYLDFSFGELESVGSVDLSSRSARSKSISPRQICTISFDSDQIS